MKIQTNHTPRWTNRAICSFALLVSLSLWSEVQAVTVPYSYTGANASFVVPSGVTQISVKLWGAGGGSGGATAPFASGPGGAGGFTTGIMTSSPGDSLTVIVGEGGFYGNSSGGTFGGGGDGTTFGSGGAFGGDGGGRSALRMGSIELFTAGGGGGSNGSHAGMGGAGGGLVGGSSGTIPAIPEIATGGTQTAGGSKSGTFFPSTANGSMFLGGSIPSTSNSGGGGGGGYYGGGAGYGGGGGGSGFVSPSALSGTTTGGSGITPPSTGDVDYVAGIAVGGQRTVNSGQAGHGLVVITHNTPLLSTTPTATPIDFGSLMDGDISTLAGVVNLTNSGGTGTRITLGGASFANETQAGLFTIVSGDADDLLEDGDFSELFDLTFDATGLTPGTYMSELTFLSDFGNTTYNLSAFVQAPVPEPSTLALAAFGCLALVRRGRSDK